MNPSTQPLHPLFDPLSEYRLATRTSVWHDDGSTSVIDFFHDLARDQGLYGPTELESEVKEFLQVRGATALPALDHRFPAGPGASDRPYALQAASIDIPPLLYSVDLTEPMPTVTANRHASSFPGCGDLNNASRQSDRFGISLPGLPAKREWVALILEPLHLQYLKGLLSEAEIPSRSGALPQEEILDEQDVIRVIRECLTYETLLPSAEALRRRASRISLLLSLAPALQGNTGTAGEIAVDIHLNYPCPLLTAGSGVVVCIGSQ